MSVRSAALLAAIVPGLAFAGTPPNTSPQTTTFQAKLTITQECAVGTVSDMDFTPATGVGFLTSDLTATTTITVGCTKGTVGTVALSDGGNFSSGTRRMANGTDFVNYNLFTTSAHSTVWDTTNTQDVTGTGKQSGGSPLLDQSLTVFGKVPAQDVGAPGAYADTITVQVTF